jgi:hypothetical protein
VYEKLQSLDEMPPMNFGEFLDAKCTLELDSQEVINSAHSLLSNRKEFIKKEEFIEETKRLKIRMLFNDNSDNTSVVKYVEEDDDE